MYFDLDAVAVLEGDRCSRNEMHSKYFIYVRKLLIIRLIQLIRNKLIFQNKVV